MKKLIIILLLFTNIIVYGHPYNVETLLRRRPYLILSYNNSNAYNMQMNLSLKLLNGIGFYKNIYYESLNFIYGLRLNKDNMAAHKFKFLLLSYQGFFYNTLIQNIKGKYLFNHFGFKLIEWSNLDNYTDFNVFQVSSELTLENRTHQSYVYGLDYKPNEHNIYFIPRLTFGLNKINLKNNLFELPVDIASNSFWDTPIGLYLELGYDWTKEIEVIHKTQIGDSKGYRDIKNSIFLTYNYELYPFNNMRVTNYGIKLNLCPYYYFLEFNLSFKRNEINIDGFRDHNYILSVEYPIEFYYFK